MGEKGQLFLLVTCHFTNVASKLERGDDHLVNIELIDRQEWRLKLVDESMTKNKIFTALAGVTVD